MTNRKIALMAFWIAVLALCGALSASVNPKVQLQGYTLSEVPAEPGHTLALTLLLKSMESDNCAESVAVQVAVSYPLSVLGSDTQYVGLLCSRDPDSAGTVTFILPISNLATSGTYPVAVTTTYEKRFTKLSESNTVNVQVGGEPSFEASIASSAPVDIYPGDTARVTVAFQNTGASMVRSARASAYSSGIVVKWAGQSQGIGSIDARGSASATFAIEAPKGLYSGDYPLTVRLSYDSENQSRGSAEFRFEVPVKPKADFEAKPASPALMPGEKREMQIALTNTGAQDANKLKVRIKPLFPFSTDGTVRYVEALEAGQAVNLTYVITVDKDAASGGQLLGFIVEFEDPQGKAFSDTADFAMPVRMPTLADDAAAFWYVWAGIIVIGGYVLLKGRRKKPAAA